MGGHAAAIAARLGPKGVIALNDADPANLSRSEARVRGDRGAAPRVVALQGNFADAPRRLVEQGLAADVVLADLGFASPQMEDASRGLSFMREGPLDMRFDPSGPVTAADLVNTLPEQDLGEILRDFGEERAHRVIARKLVAARSEGPIQTTAQLAQIVRSAIGKQRGMSRIDPATKTFQALRIAVNDELGSLGALLEAIRRAAVALATGGKAAAVWLRPGARIAVISFHSLEDRMVKQAFGDLVRQGLAQALTRKPVEADEAEVAANPRSRSAKLRAIALPG